MSFRRNPNVAKKLLRLPAVKEKTGLSRSTIYARIAAGTFPRPLDLGPNTRAWLLSDVDSWIDGRIAASRHLQERVSC